MFIVNMRDQDDEYRFLGAYSTEQEAQAVIEVLTKDFDDDKVELYITEGEESIWI